MKHSHAGRGAITSPRTFSPALALSLVVLVATSALADEPVDFDPALLLADDPIVVAVEAAPQPAPSYEDAAASDVPMAPLEGDLADYLAESTAEWSLAPGETLRGVLTRWADQAGWSIVWDATRDYPIQAHLTFPRGTPFTEALREVTKAVWRQNPTLRATVYKNKVVVFTDNGSEGMNP